MQVVVVVGSAGLAALDRAIPQRRLISIPKAVLPGPVVVVDTKVAVAVAAMVAAVGLTGLLAVVEVVAVA